MINIKLSFCSPDWPILRQTPGSKGIWGNCRFYVNDECDEFDYWVVYDTLTEKLKAKSKCTILITGEPESIKSYNPSYLKQFNYVITCQENLKHNHLIISQEALPWHIGRVQNNHINLAFIKNYDELKKSSTLKKEKLISVIASNKTSTKGHQERVKFIQTLKYEFGDLIDIFGRGYNEIDVKWDAIAPYKYHVVLENSSYQNYWTEKLADCYLAGSFPIYYGCLNLHEYFPHGSYEEININDPQKAIQAINKCINGDIYEGNVDKIDLCKNLVLDKYNLFPMVVDLINAGTIKTGSKYFKKKKLLPENWSYWESRKIWVRRILGFPLNSIYRAFKNFYFFVFKPFLPVEKK
jgi:hypothetical protein